MGTRLSFLVPRSSFLALTVAFSSLGLAFPAIGFAADIPEGWVHVKEGETSFDFAEPGVLVVDATNDRAAFPTIQGEFSFSDRTEFLAFLKSAFNARLLPDDVNPVGFDLQVQMRGAAWRYDSISDSAIPVRDPVTTFLGGETGYMTIGGVRTCVNGDLCQIAGAPDPDGWALAEESAPMYGTDGLPDPPPVTPPAIVVEGRSAISDLVYAIPDWTALRGFYAETRLKQGGVTKMVLEGKLDLSKPGELICFNGICRFKAPVDLSTIKLKKGSSTIYVSMMTVEWNSNGACPIRVIDAFPNNAKDEQRVSVFTFGTKEPHGMASPSFYADGLFTRHTGVDDDTAQTHSTTSWVDAGASFSGASCNF